MEIMSTLETQSDKKTVRTHRLPVSNFRLDKTTLRFLATMARDESKEHGTNISKAAVVRMAIHERYHKRKRDA
jgi:hypothetical protein